MNKSYRVGYEFIACILLVSLCLQGCNGLNNSIIPIGGEKIASIQTNTQATHIEPLIGQELVSQGGHTITCYQENGKLKADVEMNVPQGFSKTYKGINVYVEQGVDPTKLLRLDAQAQKNRIRLQAAKGRQLPKVIIYKETGLMGGMQGDEDIDNGEEGKELLNLPTELLDKILKYLPIDAREATKLVNKRLYALIKHLENRSQTRLYNAIDGNNIIELKDLLNHYYVLLDHVGRYDENGVPITPSILARKKNCTEILDLLEKERASRVKSINKARMAITINNPSNYGPLQRHREIYQSLRSSFDSNCSVGDLGTKSLYIPQYLYWAAEEGHAELTMVFILLIKRAVGPEPTDPLEKKVWLENVKQHVDFKDAEGDTPLYLAIMNGHLTVAKILIEEGAADINVIDNYGMNLLHLAISEDHVEIAKFLIQTGADIDAQDNNKNTPLHLAVEKGNIKIVRFLIEHGANINLQDEEESTPLHLAIEKENIEIIKFFIEHGVDIDFQDEDECTLLHGASAVGKLGQVKILVKCGANVNASDSNGYTPLHYAAVLGHSEVVKLLLEHGADRNITNANGKTPYEMAIGKKHTTVADLLLHYLIE
jgi:ankyrin repeat protein